MSAVCAEIDRFGISPSLVVSWITTTTTEEEDSTCVSFKFFQVYIPNRLEFDFFLRRPKKVSIAPGNWFRVWSTLDEGLWFQVELTRATTASNTRPARLLRHTNNKRQKGKKIKNKNLTCAYLTSQKKTQKTPDSSSSSLYSTQVEFQDPSGSTVFMLL